MKTVYCILATLLSATLLATAPTDFAKTFTVTVPAGLVDGQIADFPLLVRLGTGIVGFDYADFRQNGADILVTDAEGEPLPHELENWDTSGVSRLWMQVPSVAQGTVIRVYYGSNAAITPVPGMWGSYAGVWHLNEEGDGAVQIIDSTTNAMNGTAQSVSLEVTDAPLGRARRIAQDNEHAPGIIVPATSGLQKDAADRLGTDFHASFWLRAQGEVKWSNILGRRKGDQGTSWGFAFHGDSNDANQSKYMRVFAGSTTVNVTTNEIGALLRETTSKTWKKVDVVWKYASNGNSPVADIYTNGVLASVKDLPQAVALQNANIGIGCSTQDQYGSDNNNKKGRRLNGDMDEVRLRYGASSAARIAAEWRQESGAAAVVCGEVGLVDAGAPVVSAPTIVRDADGTFTVSVVVSENDAAPGSVKCFAAGLEFAMVSADASLPKTYAATLTGLPANTTLVYSVQAQSSVGDTLNRSGMEPFHTGDLAVAKIADGDEDGPVAGIFRISRADTGPELPVAFTLGGSAEEGRSYQAMSRTATIPDGATSVDVEIHPLLDQTSDATVTVVLTLSPGLYGISGTDGSATLSIKPLGLPSDRNTWIAAEAGLASDAANWSFDHAPRANEHVQFDGRFSNASCEWDALATHEVAAWTQHYGYTGTVTVCTVFPEKGDFKNLVVAGAMVLDAGSITHPQSRVMADYHNENWDWLGDLKANETYRLRLTVGSLYVGAGAMIDARGKGYYATNNGARLSGCAHGGRSSDIAPPCYGNPREPVDIGLPWRRSDNRWNGKGGGAVYIVASGAIVVDGTIRADSFDGSSGFTGDSWGGAFGAAGSVYLCADTVSGSGTITADGPGNNEVGNTFDDVPYTIQPDSNFKGTGGRVAIRTRLPVDRSTFARITAEGFWMGSPAANWCANNSGGSGTVVFIDDTRPNGLLVLSQQPNADPPSLRPDKVTFHRCPSVSTDADWTFDAIEFGRRGFLRVPVGTTLTLPGGFASCYGTETDYATYGGIRYEGGTIDPGAGDQTLSRNWTFFAWSNYVFSANVVVTNGATIGVPTITDIVDNGTLPEIIPTCSVEVSGDLLVGANAAIRAADCGIVATNDYASTVATGVHSHGGRSIYRGRDASGALESRAFDSVFSPRLPGCTAGAGIGVAENSKTQRGGGAVRVVVGGTLTMDGEAFVSGQPEDRNKGGNFGSRTGGAGGSLDITAGRLVGSGSFRANGGNYNDFSGPGGRIAVRLTAPGADFGTFSGAIHAGGGSWWKGGTNAIHDASAGTVYLETAADGDKCGTIRISMDPINSGYIKSRIKGGNPTNTNTTEMVSLGYGGDGLGDYKHARYVIADYGRAAVNADFNAHSVMLADDTVALDLEGHELFVREFYWVSNSGVKTNRLWSGEYSAAQLSGLGVPGVEDSSSVKSGKVVVYRGKFTLSIR